MLTIVFTRIADYFKNNHLIFLVFLCSGIICNIAFIYFFGNLMTYMNLRNAPESVFRRYSIEWKQEYPISDAELSVLLELDNIGDVALCKRINKQDDTYLYASIYENDTWYPVSGRVIFSQEELKGESVVIAPSVNTKIATDTIELFGNTYTVIGVHTLASEYRIPYQAFIKNELKPNIIQLTCRDVPSERADSELMTQLYRMFPEAAIQSPLAYQRIGKNSFSFELVLLCLMYAVCLLSFLFLMKYMVEKNYVENIIYSIVGASRSTVAFILLLESICISILIGGVSILLHIGFYDCFFAKVNFVSYITYRPSDYLIILCSTVLVTTLMNIPFILSHYRNSLITIKNKYMR